MLKLFHLPNMRYIGLNMELSDLLMRRQQKKIPKYRRDKHITNMDKISYEIYCNQYESARNYPITEEKQEMLIQLKELLSTFSERERDLFDYIHNQQLTYAEAAEKMDIKVGTAKSMSQRIRNKIDAYFEYGHQISLF